MNTNHPYETLLIRYLANDVTPEETAEVEQWISASAANKAYFEELSKTWRLAGVPEAFAKIKVDEKWNYFNDTVIAKPRKLRWLLPVSVAASILLVIGLSWNSLFPGKQAPVVVKEQKHSDTQVYFRRHEVNTSGKQKSIQLPDGSQILLADKSELTWREPFTGAREFSLKGKAYFKVAKDKTKPFRVTSAGITTTALGTEFLVNAWSVRLYEAKVVVQKDSMKDVYLSPGQEFIYGNPPIVKSFQVKETEDPVTILDERPLRDRPYIPYDADSNWYMFNNQRLEDVLNELSALHQVRIIYDKKDIQRITFTGKYNKSDSLETILQRIGIINQLKITKTATAYIVSK